jgi:hypothetical protein
VQKYIKVGIWGNYLSVSRKTQKQNHLRPTRPRRIHQQQMVASMQHVLFYAAPILLGILLIGDTYKQQIAGVLRHLGRILLALHLLNDRSTGK